MEGLATSRRTSARAILAFAVVLLALLIAPLAANASAVEALSGCTANTLPANDDESTDQVDIGFTMSLNDTDYTKLYVNNNGNVSFDRSFGDYTPFDFTLTGDKMIAPFLADVDTTGDGSLEVTYGPIADYHGTGHKAFCVNWVDVGYYGSHDDKLNSFQLILVDTGGGSFDIVANYDRVLWETGDASD